MNKYHYTESGLTNVFIEGLETVTDADGDQVITIAGINFLHATIVKGIVSRDGSISGAEIRFLRTELGLTQAQLAVLLHCDKQTVGRWERQETEIDGNAETVLRRLAIEGLLDEFERSIEDLSRSSVGRAVAAPINIRANNGEYYLVA